MNAVAAVTFAIVVITGMVAITGAVYHTTRHTRPLMPPSFYDEISGRLGHPGLLDFDIACPPWPITPLPAPDRRTRAALAALSNEH